MTRDADVLVIGGGLVGAAAALELARAGRSVTVLEKSSTAHDKVCGEFLSYESLLYLERYGVDARLLGGVPLEQVRLAGPNLEQTSKLPFAALSLTRRALDEAMLQQAALAGVRVVRGAHVMGLLRQGGRWQATLQDDRVLHTGDVMLATGKLDLGGWGRPPGRQAGLVAFKMYFRVREDQQQELARTVELHLFAGGYAGLQPVEGGRTNLCLLIAGKHLRAVGGRWENVLRHVLDHSPLLAGRLREATALLSRPLTAARIPYGFVQRSAQPGLWRVGDQAVVIPSFSGDGTAIALHSGALAASCLNQGLSASIFQQELHRQFSARVWLATGISQLLIGCPQASHAVRIFPVLLRTIAAATRIPERALIAHR